MAKHHISSIHTAGGGLPAVPLLIALAKGAAGWLTGSLALLADAAHTFSGVLRTPLGPLLKRVKLPWKEGNAPVRAESAESVLPAALVLLLGLETAFASVRALYSSSETAPSWYAAAFAALACVVQEAVGRFRSPSAGTRKFAQEFRRSGRLSAWVALVGTGGAALAGAAGVKPLYALDTLSGLLVSVLVLRLGFLLAGGTWSSPARGEERLDLQQMLGDVQKVEGVITVDDLAITEHGQDVMISASIRVNPQISVAEGHEIAKAVKNRLMRERLHIKEVAVQVHPYDRGYPYNKLDAPPGYFQNLLH